MTTTKGSRSWSKRKSSIGLLTAVALCAVAAFSAPRVARADATPTDLLDTATITAASVSTNAAEADPSVLNDGSADTRYVFTTRGIGTSNHIDIDLGSVQDVSMMQLFGVSGHAQNGQARIHVSETPITQTLRAGEFTLPAATSNSETISFATDASATRSIRYIRINPRFNAWNVSFSEIDVFGALNLADPNSVIDPTVSLTSGAIATQWPGQTGIRTGLDPMLIFDGSTATGAETGTKDAGVTIDGAFLQVDLRSAMNIGRIEIDQLTLATCSGGVRVLTTDDAGFSGTDLASTDAGSPGRSSAYTETDLGVVTGNVGFDIEASVRFVRIQRTSCGAIGANEVRVLPSTAAVTIDHIDTQIVEVGAADNVAIHTRADAQVAVSVKGLPRGLSFDVLNRSIIGNPEIKGRWYAEATVLAADGRTSTVRFDFVVTDGAPIGEQYEPPAVDITQLNNRPVGTVNGVMGSQGTNDQSGGNANDTTPSLDITVWDLVQLGDHMYVGGEFDRVTGPGGADQAFLARFDIDTGAWDSSFRPVLDGNVHALEISPRGRLLIGGEFTNVDGVAGTAGLAAIDVRTGQVDTSFQAWVERPWNPDSPAVVRDIEVVGDYLYIIGKFSHINGAGGGRERAYSAARVSAGYGTIDSSWKPVITGSSGWGINANHEADRVYFAGFMSAINAMPDTAGGAGVDATTGAFAPDNYLPNILGNDRQKFDVTSFDDVFWTAGAEHYVARNFIDQAPPGVSTDIWATAGTRANGTCCEAGGDYQFIEKIGDFIVTGCHCQAGILPSGTPSHYSNVTGERTEHRVAIVYYATGPNVGAPLEEFIPDIEGGIDGTWAATTDTNGCLWFGGDISKAGARTGQTVFANGFARYCADAADSVGSLAVSEATATQITLTWDAPAGDASGGYVIERDGRYNGYVGPNAATTYTDTTVEAFETYTYNVFPQTFLEVRGAGSSINATAGGDTEPPSIPTNLGVTLAAGQISLTWDPSTDDSVVSGYLIYRNEAYIGFVSGTVFSEAFVADATYRVRAVDVAERRSDKSPAISVDEAIPDTEAPTVPAGLAATDNGGSASITWDPSTDDRQVTGYLIYRNNGYLGWSATPGFTDANATDGDVYSVRSQDGTNQSAKSVEVTYSDPAGPDTEAPTIPAGVSAQANGTTVTLNWDPSSDNAGATGYLVYRDGAYAGFASTTTYSDEGLAPGTYSYQLRAIDAAQNRSEKSLVVVVDIG